MINQLKSEQLLLIDAAGASLSAFLLGIVLTRFESTFGMPSNTLYLLALLPCLFAVYDLISYMLVTKDHAPYLKGIAFANWMYCATSFGFAVYHHQKLTTLGWSYFLVEIFIVAFLAGIEFRVASNSTNVLKN